MDSTSLRGRFSQVYPPKPTFTEEHIPDLTNKVYIVTGSNTGVGKEVARILYEKGAKVYIAARSREKAVDAIQSIIDSAAAASPSHLRGELVFLPLDLANLASVRESANEFISKETKLHVLFNNAGLMNTPPGSTTEQGHEMMLGVNNIGTFLFTKLLTPVLTRTAAAEPKGSVRVVWVSSSAAEFVSPKPGGVPLDRLHEYTEWSKTQSPMFRYGVSKAGNFLHAVEYAKRHEKDGIVSVALNPGNLDSDLYREFGKVISTVIRTFVLHPPVYGAYTEIFAGLSPDVTMDKTGSWIVPWGRFMTIRKDLMEAGVAAKFYDWTEEQVQAYLL